MIVVHAFLHSRPDTREAFTEALRDLRASTIEQDPGCLEYAFYTDIGDPDRFVCVERWADMAGLRAHLAAAHHAEGSARLDALRAEPAQVRVFEAEPIDL